MEWRQYVCYVSCMTLGNVGKASYSEFAGKRKLLIVPYIVAFSDDAALVEMVQTYWRDAVAQVRNLERGLGTATHLFHEGATEGGEEGVRALESGNPHGYAELKGLVEGGATFEQTEDVESLLEAMDLHRCMSIVQASNRVAARLMQWFEESRTARHQAIAARIDERMEADSVGILVVSPDHDIKFPANVEAVYVVPPVLDKINMWMREHPIGADQTPPSGDDETPDWAKR